MEKRYPLHRRTRQILSSMEKDYGALIPWLDCFELIVDLDEKVRRCFEPAEIEQIEILDQPIHCGSADFYVLSQMAVDWHDEFCRCFPNAPKMQEAAYLYASAHSMNPGVLNKVWADKQKLAIEVFSWRSSCGVKPGQIGPLMSLLNPTIPWPEGEKPDASIERKGYAGSGWMMSELCKMKQDPEFWRSGCPMIRALQDYRNCTLYSGEQKIRSMRWERWQTAACIDEQRSIGRLREWLAERKEKRSEEPTSFKEKASVLPGIAQDASGDGAHTNARGEPGASSCEARAGTAGQET